MNWFFFRLGIVVSVLYWCFMIYGYSQPNTDGFIPESHAFMAGLVPMGIGALISFVFSF